jgi:hypothetical protein
MLHYVVETTLGFREAFFGLIAQGRDIASFGTRDGKKDTYTQEEGDAELLVASAAEVVVRVLLPCHRWCTRPKSSLAS